MTSSGSPARTPSRSVAVFNDNVAGYENDVSGSRTSRPDRVQKWYDCALFYLHKADFLHVPDLRTVQSIAILTNCFNIVGDFNLYLTLIPVAIRIAKILKIDCESQLRRRPLVEQEICRRTWWTLVICEWLPVPYRPPCIHEEDFDVNLPAIANDDEIGPDGVFRTLPLSHPRPVHYHIAMIRAAQVKYRFRTALKARPLSRANVVRLVTGADEDLARIIDDLPPYLHADSDELLLPVPPSPSAQSWPPPAIGEAWDAAFSWVPRQRLLISLVLLNHRMAINNTLQSSWSDESILLQRIRSICMDSSSAMITLALQDGVELEFLNTCRRYTANLLEYSISPDGTKGHGDDIYWLASCTKLVTTVACMQLVEKKLLDLDDAGVVEQLSPELKHIRILQADGTLVDKKTPRITLRMPLMHTGK
ncbi:hypothetical protein SCUCBS95973_004101 [Sporothrix curviconia]|uniref:Centromere DNA-binding protein complex CBF3 subunit B C-terminal domain-containing protein n=1 Tax=Sporothrix curviconia TaxID=1260050 RepID=A0ABP0BKV7_9PEZI